jgi:hypothetical protein
MQIQRLAWSIAFLGVGALAFATPRVGATELHSAYVAFSAQATTGNGETQQSTPCNSSNGNADANKTTAAATKSEAHNSKAANAAQPNCYNGNFPNYANPTNAKPSAAGQTYGMNTPNATFATSAPQDPPAPGSNNTKAKTRGKKTSSSVRSHEQRKTSNSNKTNGRVSTAGGNNSKPAAQRTINPASEGYPPAWDLVPILAAPAQAWVESA